MTAAKTLFVITVSTARFFFPGVPAAVNQPEIAKPPAARSLSVEVVSAAAAGADAKASVDVPLGLKVDSPIQLLIDNTALKPAAKTDTGKTKLLQYWGIGRAVEADQPRMTTVDVAQAEAEATAEKMPDRSYGYWPSGGAKPLVADAAVAGAYALKTNFCGNTSVTLGAEQDFLDPVNITSTDSEPDLTKPIVIRWKPVARASGYLLKAYGGNATQAVTWTSATKPELAQSIEYRPLSKDDVEKYIKEGVLIPSYVASCTIPAGVFKGSASVMLVVTAVGKDLIQTDKDIETRVIVRSTASVPLHSTPYEVPEQPKKADEDKSGK